MAEGAASLRPSGRATRAAEILQGLDALRGDGALEEDRLQVARRAEAGVLVDDGLGARGDLEELGSAADASESDVSYFSNRCVD